MDDNVGTMPGVDSPTEPMPTKRYGRIPGGSATAWAVAIAGVALSLLWAGHAQAAVVVVSDDALEPERARIVPGDKVRWENVTAATQRIEGVGRPNFESLDLPARGAGERRFNRPGRYRYRVPGTGKEGEVIVGARARRPRSRGSGCNRRRVFLYNVDVRGRKAANESWLPQFRNVGAFMFSYGYTARYTRVPVVVSRSCGTRLTDVRARHPGSGTLGSYEWSDQVVSTNPADGAELPCGFNASTGALGARLTVEGALGPRGTGASISVQSRLTPDQRDALVTLLAARRDAVCDKGRLSNARIFDDLPGHGTVPIFVERYRVAGVELESPLLVLNGEFANFGRGRPAPLMKLLRGKSLSVWSRQRRYEGTSSQTTAVATAEVKVKFTRRRG